MCRLTSTLLSGSTGGGTDSDDSGTSREVCRWLRSLPELLCLWGAEFPENSAEAVGALVEVAKHALPPQQQQPLAAATGTANVGGAFHGKGAAKGKTGTAGKALVAVATGVGGRGGSWAAAASELLHSIEPGFLVEFFRRQGFLSLPVAAQMDAISLLYHLPSVPANVVSELAAACSEPATLDRNVRSFVLEVGDAVASEHAIFFMTDQYIACDVTFSNCS